MTVRPAASRIKPASGRRLHNHTPRPLFKFAGTGLASNGLSDGLRTILRVGRRFRSRRNTNQEGCGPKEAHRGTVLYIKEIAADIILG